MAVASTKPIKRVTRKPPPPAFQEPLLRENRVGDRPTEHNGVPVQREELLRNLPGAPYKISKLHLANGTVAFACRDCLFTGDERRQVQQHRNENHGARFGKRTPKVVFPTDANPLDLVLPPRANGPAPTDPMDMTLREFLSLAPSLAATADLIDRTESERDQALSALADVRASVKDDEHKIAVYNSLQDEVVDLRLKIKNAGSFDQLKAEVLELRAWKKKMITRLSALGFNFNEEG